MNLYEPPKAARVSVVCIGNVNSGLSNVSRVFVFLCIASVVEPQCRSGQDPWRGGYFPMLGMLSQNKTGTDVAKATL